MNAICVIPARGGSKGIVNKNLQLVNNQTLLQRVVEKAKFTFPKNKIFVSSDDDNILLNAQKLGVEVHRRKPEFASDECSTEYSLLNFLAETNIADDYLIFAQCTAPFLAPQEFKNVLEKLKSGCDSSFSVYPCHTFQWMVRGNKRVEPLIESSRRRIRRQELSKTYIEAGSVYGMSIKQFKQEQNRFCGNTELNIEEDGFHFEIDEPRDLTLANMIAPYFDRVEDE